MNRFDRAVYAARVSTTNHEITALRNYLRMFQTELTDLEVSAIMTTITALTAMAARNAEGL